MKRILVIFIQSVSLILSIFFAPYSAAGSILVWPIYQVIESDENGSALWLENKGNAPVGLQIRIMAWKQINFQDRYAEQKEVIGTPPFTTLEPGQRHMVRLMRATPAPVDTERSYRIIIDEITTPYAQQQATPRIGIQFQMRYLLPLFIDGAGIWTQARPGKQRLNRDPAMPDLYWHIAAVAGKPYLYIQNMGKVHARLSQVFWSSSPKGETHNLAMTQGFLGYVLPGQEMRWPLPAGISTPGAALNLFTHLSDIADPVLIKRR
ncbi:MULTISPECIES: fimbria/pilus periplasmic chaperone [unclassified Brenneria]|uniref:fimbrial biogenesis chaperone n=1 Tax=unclassified Brenneria TaxID=2634434 RepID=UPI0029C42553|nr:MULTISPECIES: fimbria/pilus periplasmic chaperone [unclassified Brenneria]MDX5629273.1 fimbria/pilus periplasmic chaperone [Brenneria sp. L3-3Z]MDX5696412.1 fimbria/pilus periplasmic chaperone [Brenneria sp. L4-2C]